MLRFGWFVATVLAAIPGSAGAHFTMLLPQAVSVRRGESVTVLYQWGHPFEHQLFDAKMPQRFIVSAPDGRTTDLLPTLAKVNVSTGASKTVTAYQCRYVPETRGDFHFILQTPATWMAEEEEFFQDSVTVILHVQAQRGWDNSPDREATVASVPLTRPYGLPAASVFQVQFLGREGGDDKKVELSVGQRLAPWAHVLVEVERYNASAPMTLPADEQITRTVKTDPNGIATTTLPDPGWWCLTASRIDGTREHEGKRYPIRQRATLWVNVDGKASER